MGRNWGELSDDERRDAIISFINHTSYDGIHERYGIDSSNWKTFDRRMREGATFYQLFKGDAPLDLNDLRERIKDYPARVVDLARGMGRPTYEVEQGIEALRRQHYNIIEIAGRTMLHTKSAPRDLPKTTLAADSMHLQFAVASDLHFGSTEQQITALRAFIIDAYERGVRVVFVPGDVCAGCSVYRGQMTDLYLPSYDMQVTAAIRAIPKLDGLRYLVLGGNHDYDAIKSGGQDMIRRLCAARDDMTYCGYDVHDVALTDRADIRMWHPSGGVPYAVSYRLQKGMESAAYEQLQTAIVEDTTPNLRAVIAGHLHIEAELSRGAIFGIQAGCFEGQTNYLKRKGLFPQVGGYHIQVWLTDSGLIQRRVFEFVPFHEIRADWRNYPELWRESDEPEQEPLFTWKAT